VHRLTDRTARTGNVTAPEFTAFEASEFCCHFRSHFPGGVKGKAEFRKAQIGKVATFNGNFAARNPVRNKRPCGLMMVCSVSRSRLGTRAAAF
jgi:hypothetical protein